MPEYRVTHYTPVWEKHEFGVKLKTKDPKKAVEYIKDHIHDLLCKAMDAGVQGETTIYIEGMDTEIVIKAEDGTELYNG